MLDILAWAITVEVLGLAALPVLRAFFTNRRDAALLSRPLGLALVAYAGWVIALLVTGGFNRIGLLFALLLLGSVSYRAHRRSAPDGAKRESLWGKEEKRAALYFWGCVGVFLLIRAGFPEIAGQEKYMDLGFLNSLTRNPAMPPLDPWMAGRTINYYYWGYLLASVLTKISGVPTLTSYNFAVATFAGYSFLAATCLGLRLSGGKRAAGLWAGIATVFGGNLTGAFDAWKAPFGKGFDYWHASRVIAPPNTINEFPFFTFLQADLHPHLLAFPYFVAAFAVAHRYLEMGGARGESGARARRPLARLAPALLLVLVAGTARAANNWNLPALAMLLVFAGVFRATAGRRWPGVAAAARGALEGGALVLASLVLWAPYTRSYALHSQGLAMTTMRSDLLEFLGVWGIVFGAGIVSLLALLPEREEAARRRRDLTIAAVPAGALLIALVARIPPLPVIVPFAALAAVYAWRALKEPREDAADMFLGFCVLLALAMIGGCEFLYFKDNYGADLQRMNTIFKFYHQAWPLLAIPVAVLAERAWRREARSRPAVRAVLGVAAVLLLLYPVDALFSRLRLAQGGLTWSGWPALVRRAAGDAFAIQWLQRNAPRGSVVLESTGDPYSEYARISSHTGIPTVIGWANHEGLWRDNDREIAERAGMVRAFYSAPDARTALAVVQRYGVTHVVVGELERRTYPSADAVGGYGFLQPAFPGATTVYRVFGSR